MLSSLPLFLQVDLLGSVSELSWALNEILRDEKPLEKDLRALMSQDLFQDPDWDEISPKTSLMSIPRGVFLCAVLKAILTREEAAFCFLGPPPSVPKTEWFCCFSPCRMYRSYHSVNMYTIAFLRVLLSYLSRDIAQVFSDLSATQEVLNEFRAFFLHDDLWDQGKSPTYEPLLLLPLLKLPQMVLNELKAYLPRFTRGKEANFFVCPSHFGFLLNRRDRININPRFFSYHAFRLQLAFKPFEFGFVGPQNRLARATAKNPIDFLEKLISLHEKRSGESGLSCQVTSFDHEPYLLASAVDQLHTLFDGLTSATPVLNRDAIEFTHRGRPIPWSEIKPKVEMSTRKTPRLIRTQKRAGPAVAITHKDPRLKEIRSRVLRLLRNYRHTSRLMLDEQGWDIEEATPFQRCDLIQRFHALQKASEDKGPQAEPGSPAPLVMGGLSPLSSSSEEGQLASTPTPGGMMTPASSITPPKASLPEDDVPMITLIRPLVIHRPGEKSTSVEDINLDVDLRGPAAVPSSIAQGATPFRDGLQNQGAPLALGEPFSLNPLNNR